MSAHGEHGSGWANDPIRGAGGRRRYNAERQWAARDRQRQILRLLLDEGRGPFEPGIQQVLATRLGVHRTTVGRDIKAVFARHPG